MPDVDNEPTEAHQALAGLTVRTGVRQRLWPRVLALLAVVAVIVGLGTWQFVGLHDQIHQLQSTTSTQLKQIQSSDKEISNLKSSLGAAVGCLQTSQAQQGLCSQFVP